MLSLKLAGLLATRAYDVSSGIAKRGAEGAKTGPSTDSVLFVALVLLNILIFVPLVLYVAYTLNQLIPVLAFVESKPAYDTIPLEEDHHEGEKEVQSDSIEERPATQSRFTSSSLRAIHRLLWSMGGTRSLFRAMFWQIVANSAENIVSIILRRVAGVPAVVGDTLGTVLAVQLEILWIHSLISRSKTPMRKRIVGFNEAFRVTAIPALIVCAVNSLSEVVPKLVLAFENAPIQQYYGIPIDLPAAGVEIWKIAVFIFVHVAFAALLSVPAEAVLVRAQASLLSADAETIVPFDRTFGIEEARENGHLSVLQAFKSLKGAWGRLYKLLIKIFLLGCGLEVLFIMFLGLEFLVMNYLGTK